MIAPDRLKEIRALCDAAPVDLMKDIHGIYTMSKATKLYIAQSRQIIPELLGEIERLREALTYYKGLLWRA